MHFLTGEPLAEEIYDLIYKAEKELIILSPYISLGNYLKEQVFKTHLNNPELSFILGFGKNEENVSKSVKKVDIDFFKQFPNVSIVYIKDLHGKFYCNEKKVINTSMNLVDYSLLNNIEFGNLAVKKLMAKNGFYDQSKQSILSIIENEGNTIFVKRPKYRKKIFGKDFRGSDIKHDTTDKIFSNITPERTALTQFNSELHVNPELKEEREKRNLILEKSNTQYVSKQKETNKKSYSSDKGFCIRCKEIIPKNSERPLCYKDYNTWKKFSDKNYKEKYCHSCGEKYDTSFAKPECKSCFVKNNRQLVGNNFIK